MTLKLSEITLTRLADLKKAQIRFNKIPSAINFQELQNRMLDYQDSYNCDYQENEKNSVLTRVQVLASKTKVLIIDGGMRHNCIGTLEGKHSEEEYIIQFSDGTYSYFTKSEFKVVKN